MQRPFLSFVLIWSLLAVPASIYSQEAGQWSYFQRAKQSYQKGQYDKCIKDLDEVLRLNPDSAAAFSLRGEVWLAKKRDFDKAIADFTQVLWLDPRDATVYGYRGYALDMKGEYDKAIADFNQVLRLRPHDIDAYGNRGLSWTHKGEYDKSIEDFTRMAWLASSDALTHVLRGTARAAEYEYDEALGELDRALALQYPLAAALVCRGNDWDCKGEYAKALDDFKQAVCIQPEHAEYHNGLAWILATCPDDRYRNGEEAVAAANKGCQLKGGKIASHFDTLAAAYAETGDFENARQWQKKAIAANTDEQYKQEYQSRLKLYEQNQPYRDVKKATGK